MPDNYVGVWKDAHQRIDEAIIAHVAGLGADEKLGRLQLAIPVGRADAWLQYYLERDYRQVGWSRASVKQEVGGDCYLYLEE